MPLTEVRLQSRTAQEESLLLEALLSHVHCYAHVAEPEQADDGRWHVWHRRLSIGGVGDDQDRARLDAVASLQAWAAAWQPPDRRGFYDSSEYAVREIGRLASTAEIDAWFADGILRQKADEAQYPDEDWAEDDDLDDAPDSDSW